MNTIYQNPRSRALVEARRRKKEKKPEVYLTKINQEGPEPGSDLHALNRQYLLLARELSRHQPAKAEELLGVPARYQSCLAGLTYAQIDSLASSPTVLFQLRFSHTNFWKSCNEKTSEAMRPYTHLVATAMSLAQTQHQEVEDGR
ncbi:MAG: flagellar transcriptional regulator FlhD [Desulfuromonas thiophila]|jgi:hypothetical protein|nr:flagellar transcriptional regulator FlhD [Desulfuromonas thiophila]MDY0251356.1 flagellar transcriptional regulator FlhD [Pseudomonas sp.]